jgi:hypothetical protein
MDSLSSETTSTIRTLIARLPPGLQGVLLAKGPSGFKNFFPEEGGDSKGTESSGGDEDGPKKEKKQRPSSKKKKDGEGDGNQLSDHIGKIGIVLALLVPFLLRDNGPAGTPSYPLFTLAARSLNLVLALADRLFFEFVEP